jgi:hypothetical protein
MESQCYKYKMQKDDLRKLTVEIFEYHGVSPNWIRELLPEGLKYTSKTRISYLHRQEIEKETPSSSGYYSPKKHHHHPQNLARNLSQQILVRNLTRESMLQQIMSS